MNWLFSLVEYLTSFVEIYILLCLFGTLFPKKYSPIKHQVIKLLFAFCVMCLTVFLNSIQLYSYFTATIWIPLAALLAIILYKGKYLPALCLSVVFVVIINAMDFLAISVIELVFEFRGITLEVMTSAGWNRSIFAILMKVLLILIYLPFSRKKSKYLSFDSKSYYAIIAASIFCFFCMQYLIEAVIIGNVVDMRRAVLIAWIFIILFVISFILILRGNMRFTSERLANSIVSTRLEVLEEDNKNLNDAYGEIAKITHDYKNHMCAMMLLAQNHKYKELTQYLEQVSSAVDNIQIYSYSGIESIDAVINNKKAIAEKLGISIDINVSPLYNLHVRSMDLCAVIVNLLDNAIEATIRLDEMNKNMSLSISTIHSMIVVKTKNRFDSSSMIQSNNGDIETSKKNRQLHGYGLRIVKAIAEKYNGSFEFTFENDQFEAIVMLANSI